MPSLYFGNPKFRKEYETQIDPPVGWACCYCDERITADDTGTIEADGMPWHYECRLRLACGSVGHQQHKCFCYGGTEEDPPGMTKREAAIAAARLWHMNPVLWE